MYLKLQIIGNLAADAREIQGKEGKSNFISFTVMCNQKFGEKEITTAVEVTAPVSGILPYLTKGKKVLVEGTPSVSAYLDKENHPQGKLTISRNVNVVLLSKLA